MTKYTSPADVIAAIVEAARLWDERENAQLDVRVAERSGDDTAVTVARLALKDAGAAWYAAQLAAKEAVKSALDTLGLDGNLIKPYL